MGIRLSPKLHQGTQAVLWYWCPGCEMRHPVYIRPDHGVSGQKDLWSWNGDVDAPTFHPSIVVRLGPERHCHSWIKHGVIDFLSDCTHPLRGQKVALPDIPKDE